DDYNAAVLGVEYSFYSLFDTDIDLTLITEYLWDSRDDAAPGVFERDVGLGARFTLNDEFDTTFLAGFIWDPQTDEKIASLEGERRLFSDFRVKLMSRVLMKRGQPELDDTAIDILKALANSPLANDLIVDQGFIIE